MKLYTEEEIVSFLKKEFADEIDAETFMKNLTPIELASDTVCINCDESKSTHNICMDCIIKVGKQNIEIPSDGELRKMAKTICDGHQHAKRYNQMLKCCFQMGQLVIEKIQGGNK